MKTILIALLLDCSALAGPIGNGLVRWALGIGACVFGCICCYIGFCCVGDYRVPFISRPIKSGLQSALLGLLFFSLATAFALSIFVIGHP